MTVNKERVELFAQALESDRYHQCRNQLRTWKYDYEARQGVPYNCALGVAIDVALVNGLDTGILMKKVLNSVSIDTWLYAGGQLPDVVANWYGFKDLDPVIVIDEGNGPIEATISEFNDDGRTFWEIAQAVRAGYLKDEG